MRFLMMMLRRQMKMKIQGSDDFSCMQTFVQAKEKVVADLAVRQNKLHKYLDKGPIGQTLLKNINPTNVMAVPVFWILNCDSLIYSA